MNPQPKPSIFLYSDFNFLAVSILENLLSKDCVVNIVTGDVDNWKNNTKHLVTNEKFSIVDRKKIVEDNPYNYAIFCGGFVSSDNVYNDFFDFISLKNIVAAKTLSIFPLEVFDRSQIDKIRMSNITALLFLGDLLGPRINLNSDLLISRLLSEILWKRKITLAVGETLFPVFVADAVRVIVKWLFSFGPYGKTILLLGSQTSGDTFWIANKKYFGELALKYDSKITARDIPKNIETEIVNSNLTYCLNETFNWIKGRWSVSAKPPDKKKEKPRIIVKQLSVKPLTEKLINSKETRNPKRFKLGILLIILFFVFPFIALFISLSISFIGYKSFLSGGDNFAKNSFILARSVAVASEKESNILGYIPGLGLIYKETEFAALITQNANSIGTHLIPVVRDSTQLLENVLGNKVYDSVDGSRNIESEVAALENDIIAAKNLTNIASSKNIVLARKILSLVDFERFTTLISQSRILTGNLPELLGQNETKTYLLLFQNNMELRPTGGFIGSFGLVTFDKGRLTDLTVNDVYSADGQLNGHVEPPYPIRNYLGEANWWLRDSNWDPDFPTSAKRAEWFLDKEISKKVDGVAAIDLFPIKDILKSTGPVFLSDYNMAIDSDNLYEKTQSEVDNNFFPGTHKKASFLAALSRSLLTEVVKLETNQKLEVLNVLYASLNGRHTQIYIHDNNIQQVFSRLGWDGAVANPSCGTDCYADTTGIVEANVGMNKVNYFIERKITLDVALGTNEINHKLTLTLKNKANPALGPSSRYKNYVRILIPSDSTLTSVTGGSGSVQENLNPEITETKGHNEVGVLVELLAGNTKNIEFSWTSDSIKTHNYSNYGIYFRKQAGTDLDPVTVNISGAGSQINPDPRLTLTGQGAYSYNTTLARDLFLRLSF